METILISIYLPARDFAGNWFPLFLIVRPINGTPAFRRGFLFHVRRSQYGHENLPRQLSLRRDPL
jgi:hypothetical protein